MKNLKFLLIFFFLLSCGYIPIYQTDQNSKIKLDIINYSGNKELGRSIIKGIERLKNNESTNIYDLNFTSSKKEAIAAKDKKGNISTYKLIIEIDVSLKNKENNKVFSKKFSEETTYNSMNNKFELNQYKLNLEKNMISQILQDLNIFLSIIGNDL
ncbi:hypothetical protein [Candidatus Pelagibacter sp.]|uniref:hypothetical protein n=1 Tax=Candidatus Pelagibacter sp. TaxID=2024849 RepID=UPI003F840920|tara:strand:+ start:2426 stop:2893 length:468 start_codon:yes stop_codon:yes gene_type:complete